MSIGDGVLGVLGVPTSAGAFAPGQEQAPAALREAGLVERLTSAGVKVVDHGDRPVWRWRPDRDHRFAQNLGAVVEIAKDTAERVAEVVGNGQIPLVLGGDCTIELGTIAGHLETSTSLGLIYFDLHPDLNVPGDSGPGALDWMGMAHVLGEEGTEESLSHVGSRFPLLADEDVLFFAYGPNNRTGAEKKLMARRSLRGIRLGEVNRDPEGAARKALAALESRVDRLLVHFDVDTVDFTDLPLSENTGRNERLSFTKTMQALSVLVGSEKLSALTITELNPAHGEANGATLETFVTGLVRALANQSDRPS